MRALFPSPRLAAAATPSELADTLEDTSATSLLRPRTAASTSVRMGRSMSASLRSRTAPVQGTTEEKRGPRRQGCQSGGVAERSAAAFLSAQDETATGRGEGLRAVGGGRLDAQLPQHALLARLRLLPQGVGRPLQRSLAGAPLLRQALRERRHGLPQLGLRCLLLCQGLLCGACGREETSRRRSAG